MIEIFEENVSLLIAGAILQHNHSKIELPQLRMKFPLCRPTDFYNQFFYS